MKNEKPLGIKNYGSIPHLPNSRIGPGDHHCTEGQARIATIKKRDKYDRIIVTEKLDGSNIGIVKINNQIIPLTRAGYRAETSHYGMHHKFADFVLNKKNYKRFNNFLNNGERLIGEWVYQAHGTIYNLSHEPLVIFDLMISKERLPFDQFYDRIINNSDFTIPYILEYDNPITVEEAMKRLNTYGFHGAQEQVEGAVWKVERYKQLNNNTSQRKWAVDYLVKYVRPDKEDGKYLDQNIINQVKLREDAR